MRQNPTTLRPNKENEHMHDKNLAKCSTYVVPNLEVALVTTNCHLATTTEDLAYRDVAMDK